RRAARLGPEGMVRETLRMCTVDPGRVSEQAVAAMIEIARWRAAQPWPTAAYLEAARSLVRVLARRARFAEMAGRIEAPVLVIHGDRDRLVPLAAVRALVAGRDGWTLEVLEETGHVPMLERPEEFAASVETWLHAGGASALSAAEAARPSAAEATAAAEEPAG
ncbi:MAG: alpha/beta fold hydrolase, partial [Actinomycetota bacterium]